MRCPFCSAVFANDIDKNNKISRCLHCNTVFPTNVASHPHVYSVGNHSSFICGDSSPIPANIAIVEGV